MSFYVTGGTLQSNAPSYVEREADRQLYEGLLQGDFCYVLTARQMGKSSLMVRTANRLRMAGVHVVALDLTALGGQNITAEQWYFGLLDTLGQELGLGDELEMFWQDNEHVGPLHRFMKSIRQIVLQHLDRTGDRMEPQVEADGPSPLLGGTSPSAKPDNGAAQQISSKVRLVIFVDEIDFVRSLPFSTDEFFAAIRECYNHRTRDSTYEQVTFCLLGVASPSDLIRDTRTTPFNIGRRIELNDFTPIEAAALAQGLEDANRGYRHSKLALNRILYWTEGHPYLTQRLCRAAAEALRATDVRAGPTVESPSALVDRLCTDLFFSARARERDDNLIFVRERLLRNEADLASLLDLYLKVWQGKSVMDDEFDPLISFLRLSGAVRVTQGRLSERNLIYAYVFDDEWVRSNLPETELRRQREAYRRGVIRATALASIIIIALGLLSLVAVNKTSEAKLAQAKAWSTSGRMGQRFESLRAIEQAKRWGILRGNLPELRNEAIAALNLVDLEKDRVIPASAADVTVPELDGTFSRYAVADRSGRIRIVGVERNQLEREIAPIDLPVRWLRFSSTAESANEYFAAGYGSEGDRERRFILYRSADKSKTVDLIEDVTRDGWDISPKGDLLAVGLSLGDIRTYSLPGGQPLSEPVPDKKAQWEARISCVRFDPSGKLLAECSQSSSLNLNVWDLADGKKTSYPYSSGVVGVDWHPDGNLLATACENGEINLLDPQTGKNERLYSASAYLTPPAVCFNRMGTVLAMVCSDSSLRLWRLQNRRQILESFDPGLEFDRAMNQGTNLRFSNDDAWLAFSTGKRQLRRLKVEGGSELITFQGKSDSSGHFQSICFDPLGSTLIAAGPHRNICFWDLRDRSFRCENLPGLISMTSLNCEGDALLSSTTKGLFQIPLRLVPLGGMQELHNGPPQAIAPRLGLGRFALTTNGTAAVVFPGRNADHIHVVALNDPEHRAHSHWDADYKLDEIAITPNGQWLFASAKAERAILVWDLSGGNGGKPMRQFPGSRYLSLSPSGRWLVTVRDGKFRFREVGSWRASELSIELRQNVEEFTPIAFASLAGPAECVLAVATSPTAIDLYLFWDRASLKLEKLARLESPDRLPIVSLAFDPTCRWLAAGSKDQIVQVWNLAKIREELDRSGLAGGFPHIPLGLPGSVCFSGDPSSPHTENTESEQLQEEWLTYIDNVTEQIEVAEALGDQDGLVKLVFRRGALYRNLGRYAMALADLNEALKLRPDHPASLRMKTEVEREAELQRQTVAPAGNSAGPKSLIPN